MIIPIPFSPYWSPSYTARRLKEGRVKFTELGREVPCTKCGEWLPAETEFFHACKSKPAGIHCWCRACYNERFE